MGGGGYLGWYLECTLRAVVFHQQHEAVISVNTPASRFTKRFAEDLLNFLTVMLSGPNDEQSIKFLHIIYNKLIACERGLGELWCSAGGCGGRGGFVVVFGKPVELKA